MQCESQMQEFLPRCEHQDEDSNFAGVVRPSCLVGVQFQHRAPEL